MGEAAIIVVGQGLAGTALAWTLIERGVDVRIVDDANAQSASRVAAGLITPVVGRRLAPATGYAECFAQAQTHYRAVEAATGAAFFRPGPALRLFHTESECARLNERRAQLAERIAPMASPPAPGIVAGLGGVTLPDAARLDTRTYLDRSRRAFETRGILHRGRIDPARVTSTGEGVAVRDPALAARHLVFCGGVGDLLNPWLPAHAFSPAKGELLEVRLSGLTEDRTVHTAHGWLAPAGPPYVYRFGATYDHGDLTPACTAGARATLLKRLDGLVRIPVDVLAQHAAVRPIGKGRRPVVGRHRETPRVAWLNGLGSRGALWAPALARALCSHLLDDAPLALPMCSATTDGEG